MLLGLFYCEDRYNQKAEIFFSLLLSAYSQSVLGKSLKQRNFMCSQSCDVDQIYCVDEAVEGILFKMSVLASLFIDYWALPQRAGKTEQKMM